MATNLVEIENVNSKEDFVKFMRALLKELEKEKRSEWEDWENNTLELYLEGILNFTEHGVENHYKHFNLPFNNCEVSWNLFARILWCATVYE